MNNKPSIEVVETNFIIFHDKTVKEVSKKQGEFIMLDSLNSKNPGTVINGSFFKYSAISKVLSAKDYHDQYPDKSPSTTPNVFEEYYGGNRDYKTIESHTDSNKAKSEQMLKGLKNYIDHNKPCPNAKRIFDEKLKRFNNKYK